MAWYSCFRMSLGKFSDSFRPDRFSMNSLQVIFLLMFCPCRSVLSNMMAHVNVCTASRQDKHKVTTKAGACVVGCVPTVKMSF